MKIIPQKKEKKIQKNMNDMKRSIITTKQV